MRFDIKKIAYCSLLISTLFISSCKDENIVDEQFYAVNLQADDFLLNDITMNVGEFVSGSFKLKNTTQFPVTIEQIAVVIENVYDGNKILTEKKVAEAISLPANSVSEKISIADFYQIPEDIKPSSFCKTYLKLYLKDGLTSRTNATYFRAITDQSLVTYDVEKMDYKGVTIYNQIGDMSAGYGVLKSLTAIGKGMSATMKEAPQGGTFPVYATKDFLQKSIQRTIDLYNNELGGTTKKVKRVVIGTGITSLPYFATMMDAVYLPIHFLVSANSSKEIKTILDYSNERGYSCYSTLGYDGSMPVVGVAWIKLLDLPEEYKQFIIDHQVEEVYIYGCGEKAAGEAYARKVLYSEDMPEDGYDNGDLYILYTNFGSEGDINNLRNRLFDYTELDLGKGHMIADWESGIIEKQFNQIAKSVHENTASRAFTLTSPTDMMELYNLSSYLSLEYLKLNETKLPQTGVKGIAFNEYITCHPHYEIFNGYVPLLYWQFNSAASTVGRIDGYLKKAINQYFPSTPISSVFYRNMGFYLNSNMRRNELKDELVKKGARSESVLIRASGDRWNPSEDEFNGISTSTIGSAEEFTYNIIKNIGVDKYLSTVNSFSGLDLSHIKNIVKVMNANGKTNIELLEH